MYGFFSLFYRTAAQKLTAANQTADQVYFSNFKKHNDATKKPVTK
jgi:hypothetical protein